MPILLHRDLHSPVRVFVSAVEADRGERERLIEALNRLEKDSASNHIKFEVYSASSLRPGDVYEEMLTDWMDQAQLILLLVSPDYLASHATGLEIDVALKRRTAGQSIVVPVLLTTTPDWQITPFRDLQVLPQDGQPIDKLEDPALAWRQIAESLAQLVIDRTAPVVTQPIRASAAPAHDFRVVWLVSVICLMSASLLGVVFYAVHTEWIMRRNDGASGSSEFLISSIVVGTAAMSLLQIARRLFPIRGAFHHDLLQQWLGIDAASELHDRVGSQRTSDLFDLPAEMLSGQLSAIAELALDEEVRTGKTSTLVSQMALAEQSGVSESSTSSKVSSDQSDSRMDRALIIQRNLDQFQISSSATWKRYLLLSSIFLSFAIFVMGLGLFYSGAFIHGLKLPESKSIIASNFAILCVGAALTALFGGFLASIARDLVALIEKLRR